MPLFSRSSDPGHTISFADFKQAVYADFKKNKARYLAEAQHIAPEAGIVDVQLSGSFERGTPTEDSDVDLRVVYTRDVDRDKLLDKLMGKIGPAVGGVFDIHLLRAKLRPIRL